MNKLHCFCGPIYLDGWVNLDISDANKVDIKADILQIHFDENTFDAIYGCHGLEHISYYQDTVECLSRFYKWLKPGGILRLAVPDLGLATEMYVDSGDLKSLYGGDFKGYYYKDTPCERLNFFVKAWQHQMCYDIDLLEQLLQDAGFLIIFDRRANESAIPNFTHDRFISESLYIESIK
jgi:predicted SAM-dependent methyltransferase